MRAIEFLSDRSYRFAADQLLQDLAAMTNSNTSQELCVIVLLSSCLKKGMVRKAKKIVNTVRKSEQFSSDFKKKLACVSYDLER